MNEDVNVQKQYRIKTKNGAMKGMQSIGFKNDEEFMIKRTDASFDPDNPERSTIR
jgi:hypothetical protein